MSVIDLVIAVGAGIVGFGIIWGLFSLVRAQKAPPVEIYTSDPRPTTESRARLSVEELGRSWQTILGVPLEAGLPEIEAAYHARLAECDRVRFSSGASAAEKQDAETRRTRVSDAYEFIRRAKR